jgi:hypothetical protein
VHVARGAHGVLGEVDPLHLPAALVRGDEEHAHAAADLEHPVAGLGRVAVEEDPRAVDARLGLPALLQCAHLVQVHLVRVALGVELVVDLLELLVARHLDGEADRAARAAGERPAVLLALGRGSLRCACGTLAHARIMATAPDGVDLPSGTRWTIQA